MTSNEILKADVLDILFEHRNKQYGAYALRRFYGNRLALALGFSIALFVTGAWLIQRAAANKWADSDDSLPKPGIVRLVDLIQTPEEPILPPTPPPAAPRPIATQAYTSQIEIVANVDPNEMVPDHTDLDNSQIGTQTVAGDAPTASKTIETPPAPPAPAATGNGHEEKEFAPLERQPEFPGGVEAWRNFLGRYLRAPEEMEPGQRLTVLVKFWVGVDGSITNFEVVRSAGAAFDNEVIRVLKKMPKWKPAIQNGDPVAVTFTQPVIFQAFEE